MIYRIIQKRRIFLIISASLIMLSVAGFGIFGLKLGIDFTGGTRYELQFMNQLPATVNIEQALTDLNLGTISVQSATDNIVILKTRTLTNDERSQIVDQLNAAGFGEVKELSFNAIGPTIGHELKNKAFWSVGLVILAIILYITWAFRKVSQGPVPSWVYGCGAVIALIHDVAVVVGLFVLFGRLFNTEVDTLFVTALLTVLGFSVHDTIVVFDRIREGIRKHGQMPFEDLVNLSINETLARSINTSLTALFVLVALAVLGGDSIRMFVVALIAGIIVGTYSSIFIASPMLLIWHNYKNRQKI